MISLKRNTKGELVLATGKRSTERSIYKPNQTDDFKTSRSKFSDFLTCPRHESCENCAYAKQRASHE